MLTELSVTEYAARLGSEEPAPGGGSAAALTGLLGTSLLEMVCNLTIGRPEFSSEEELLASKRQELARIHIDLQLLVDRDAEAFSGVMKALKMTRSTDEEKTRRSAALQTAYHQAAEIPLEIARACLEALEIAKDLQGRVNAHVVSDLAIGSIQAHAGVVGALMNTAINLPALKDKALANALGGQIYLLRSSADELLSSIQAKLYKDELFAAFRS